MKACLLYVYPPVPVGLTSGIVVGRVVKVTRHLNAQHLRLALVDLGVGEPVQIVFGGPPNVHTGDLVPVAPPGSRIPSQKMRRRRYRGESSYGMLCSLAELGWNPDAPDEVALLRNVMPGDCLDNVSPGDRQSLVINTPSGIGAGLGHDTQLVPSSSCCVGGEQDQADLADASSFSSNVSTGVQLPGVSLPSGCDRDRGSLVPALRVLAPRS